MKQLIKHYNNADILDQTNVIEFFLKEVKTSTILDRDLRIAVQSLQLADDTIRSYIEKLRKVDDEQ